MNKTKFEKYSHEHIHFYDMRIPFLLKKAISIKDVDDDFDLLDIGCSDGNLIYSLKKQRIINKCEIFGWS